MTEASPLDLATDPTQKWGPNMAKLTPKQRAYVLALVEHGCNPTRAAAEAGYGSDSATQAQRDKCIKQSGWVNSHDVDIQAAVKEEAENRVRSGALIATSALIEIVADAKHKDRFKAALILGAMNGIQAVAVSEIKVHHSFDQLSTHDLMMTVTKFAVEHGMDPQRMLANAGVLDAEFEMVQPALPDYTATADGLEDLL
jgi:hypothetical protein